MGESGLAGRNVAMATRSLLDDEVGPLLVGLRTLEWRWDQLPAIGVDPDDMLADLIARAGDVVKLAGEVGVDLAELALVLYGVVVALADGVVGDADRPLELTRAVALAADLHDAVEARWRHALVGAQRLIG